MQFDLGLAFIHVSLALVRVHGIEAPSCLQRDVSKTDRTLNLLLHRRSRCFKLALGLFVQRNTLLDTRHFAQRAWLRLWSRRT